MPEEIRINRSAQQSSAQPQSGMMQEETMDQKNSKAPWIIFAVIVIVIAILGFLFRDKLKLGSSATGSGYQAVFLSNGQVYFGKISDTNDNYVTLDDIYYLQVIQQPPLQGNGQAATGTQTTQQPQISLVKLGNELHGPVDEMHISRTQILFYEDLKSDGQVVKAIVQYKASPSGGAVPTK